MFESLPCFFFLCKVVKLPIYLCCDRIKYVLACSVNYYAMLYSLHYALPTTLCFTLTTLHFTLTMLYSLRYALPTTLRLWGGVKHSIVRVKCSIVRAKRSIVRAKRSVVRVKRSVLRVKHSTLSSHYTTLYPLRYALLSLRFTLTTYCSKSKA